MYTSSLGLFFLAAIPALASITCVKPGMTATARWTNAQKQSCMWTGTVGSNFGIDGVNGGEYVVFKGKETLLLVLTSLLGIAAMAGRKLLLLQKVHV